MKQTRKDVLALIKNVTPPNIDIFHTKTAKRLIAYRRRCEALKQRFDYQLAAHEVVIGDICVVSPNPNFKDSVGAQLHTSIGVVFYTHDDRIDVEFPDEYQECISMDRAWFESDLLREIRRSVYG